MIDTKYPYILPLILLFLTFASAQTPTPTPDTRGLGIQGSESTTAPQTTQQAKEARPELVLQAGYNNFFGATRTVFSPDGRLLATGTFHSNTIKLWEIATGRELRDLSTGSQSGAALSPSIAFSRDSRLVAASGGDNSVTVWDVVSGRTVQTLAGSQGSIASVAGIYFISFTPDGRLVTASDAVRVWDVSTGQTIHSFDTSKLEFSGFNGSDGGMALTPDGKQLAMVATDSKPLVKFVDLSSGDAVRTVNLPDRDIESLQLSFSSDGHLLAAGILDKHVKLWDLTTRSDRDLGPTQKEFSQVRFSRDGQFLSLSESFVVKIWEVASGKEIRSLNVPHNDLFTQAEALVSFSENGKQMSTGGFGTPTIVWDPLTGQQLVKMNGRTNMAYSVSFSADGSQLTSGGRTRWDLRTGRGLRLLNTAPDNFYGIPSPNERLIATLNPNSGVQAIIEVPSGRTIVTLNPGGQGVVQHTRFSPDSKMLISTYAPGQNTSHTLQSLQATYAVKLWDVTSGRELRSLAMTEAPLDAGFSADNLQVVTIGSSGQISLWDVNSGAKLRDLTKSPMSNLAAFGNAARNPRSMPQMPNMADISAMMTNVIGSMSAGTMGRTVTSFAFSPDSRVLAVGGVESKSNIDLSSMMNAAMSGKKPKKGAQVPSPDDFMKNMKVEAVGQVVLWDVANGTEIAALKGHGKGVEQVAFSRDGKLLASASTDNTIRIWDVATQRELRTLSGHTANIESIDFSPDSRLLASASEDGGTFLWDVNTGEHLLTLISLDDGGEWMVVTPQGLFDGTPFSWNQILWRYNQDTFNVAPIEWFFNEFYYPGLLADVYYGKRPKVSQDVSKKDRRQPTVKLSVVGEVPATGVTTRTLKLKIEVADAAADKDHTGGCGARDLRLFRNGSLVKVWHGDVLKGQTGVTLEEDITVTAGPNRLVAYAFNRDNVKSKDAPLVFDGADNLKRKGTAYIIAVGINEYDNNQYNLKYAVADAQSFGEELRLRQTQVGNFERVEVIPLLNGDATKANILAALRRLAGAPDQPTLKATPVDSLKRAEPEDTVVIYFAGHGTAQAQRFYLIPHDLGYTGDRTKLDEQGLKTILAHSISDIELEDAFENLDAGHLLLVIDACNSGQALEAEEKRRGPMNSKGLAQLAYEKGMYILTAAQSFQAALEAAQFGHGLLTYALVEEGLKTAVADNEPKDGLVNAREWLDFATERVPQMQEDKMKQSRGVGLAIAFTEGEANIADPEKRSVQRPRVFYRRELEANPLIVAKP